MTPLMKTCVGRRIAQRGLMAGGISGLWVLGLLMACAQSFAQTPSATRGQALFESRCMACHNLDVNRVGPALRNVVGRKAGTANDYFYSQAMAEARHVWTRPLLLQWLTNPESVVAGQEMDYHVDTAADREDLVAYLVSLTESDLTAQPITKP